MKNHYPFSQLLLVLLLVLFNSCSKDQEATPEDHQIEISEITPLRGIAGTRVTIKGSGFSTEASDNIVKFNNKVATVVTASETVLTTEVPDGAGTGRVVVQVGKSTATGPEFTYLTELEVFKKYYIRFKANGVWKHFEVNEPGHSSCGDCACISLPPLDNTNFASLNICNSENNWVTAADIQSWDKKSIGIESGQGFPEAEFYYGEGEKAYFSEYVTNQTNSWIQILTVENDISMYYAKAFRVTGTFQCKVAQYDDDEEIAITEGSFVIRLTEDW